MKFSIPLNKFEKEKKVIRLHIQGKTIREIAPIVRMSFRDISKIRKECDKKIKLQQNKKDNTKSTPTKKPSLSTQAFVLYQQGKKIDEVKVLLDIPFKKAIQYWEQYLESIRMEDCYDFYKEHSNDILTFLSIDIFMKRNNVSAKNIVTVLRTTKNIINLNQMYSNIRNEVEKIRQVKNNLHYFQNKQYPPLKPFPKMINWNY